MGSDPEMKYTPNGQAVTSFSVASNRKYTTGAGEQREETEWFRASAFGKLAETCNQYLTNGQQMYVEGRLRSHTYTTQGGEIRHTNEINITDVQFLGRANNEASEWAPVDDEPDLPF